MFGQMGTPNEVADPGFALTYYLNSPEVSRAVALELQPGAEQRAIDFTLVFAKGATDGPSDRHDNWASSAECCRVHQSARFLLFITSRCFHRKNGSWTQGNRYNPATGEFVVQNNVA